MAKIVLKRKKSDNNIYVFNIYINFITKYFYSVNSR